MHPKETPQLIGHEEQVELLAADFRAGRLAHSWLITGPRGIGKASFAYAIARMLLTGRQTVDISEHDPVFRRVAAGSHTDLLAVEPKFDEKKNEYAREISVEQAREVSQFLSLTPGESDWRVVIVDAIDQMNPNAANALLKILEEPPPQAVLLLVSHQPGRLLPTIRSRCQRLSLQPLPDAAFRRVLAQSAPNAMDDAATLAAMSAGAPGLAMELAEAGALEMQRSVLDLLSMLPSIPALQIHRLAEQVAGGRNQQKLDLFGFVMLYLLAALARAGSGQLTSGITTDISAMFPPLRWAQLWQQAAEQFAICRRLHLDAKQVVIAFFHSLNGDEPFALAG